MEDFSGVVANGLGAKPPPAHVAIAGANHAGFDVVVDAGGDGVGPGFEDALAVAGIEGIEPAEAAEFVDGEADVVEEALVGVGDAAVGSSHPDGLGVEVGEDAVTLFGGGELLLRCACASVMSEVMPRR